MKNPLAGKWRITWLSNWDQDYVDMEVPGHFTFGPARSGSFQFGLLQGQMDCRVDRQPGPRVEFTWDAFDEGDVVTGRGYAEIVDGNLQGRIYVHLGDESEFLAMKQPPRKRSRRTAR